MRNQQENFIKRHALSDILVALNLVLPFEVLAWQIIYINFASGQRQLMKPSIPIKKVASRDKHPNHFRDTIFPLTQRLPNRQSFQTQVTRNEHSNDDFSIPFCSAV
jgi:hypothetical protein